MLLTETIAVESVITNVIFFYFTNHTDLSKYRTGNTGVRTSPTTELALWLADASAQKLMKRLPIRLLSIAAIVFAFVSGRAIAADKVRMAYVSPSVSLSLPWMAKETGILAKHDLVAAVLLITGSPRLVQTLIAGGVRRCKLL
jgi:hypothetical protein